MLYQWSESLILRHAVAAQREGVYLPVAAVSLARVTRHCVVLYSEIGLGVSALRVQYVGDAMGPSVLHP
jgi:alpha-D-ribose 1-methylphosphonate 5-triphosphate synthase subunit PhnL